MANAVAMKNNVTYISEDMQKVLPADVPLIR